MANVVVVGSQWGDEGKGKIVDWLSERAQVVVRFQGGHNAGHTLVIDGQVFKLNLLPSGIVRPGKISVIGNGVVLDPWALIQEIEKLTAQGVDICSQNLRIADNICLILPLHQELDARREQAGAASSVGSTQRGIGPAYEDKVGRRALRLADLEDEEAVNDRLDRLAAHHNPLRKGLGMPPLDMGALKKSIMEIAPKLLPFRTQVWRELEKFRAQGHRILFEGAQGTLLDIDHGTYPYVTSSSVVAAQASTGSGVGLDALHYVLGITKAYSTRVGAGPFPTELHDEVGQLIGERGREFGTVTGRKRRCGWFDAVIVRQMLSISGVRGIALTKMDVMDTLDQIKICVGYRLDGKAIDYLPAGGGAQARVEPVYEIIDGWKASTQGARRWVDLPAQAVKYVRRIEELVGVPVAMLSTSPERLDTILVQDPFRD